MKQTQGFGTMGIIGLAAVVLIMGAIGLTLNNNSKVAEEKAMMAEKMQMEEKAMMEQKAMEEKAMMEKEAMSVEEKAMMDKGGEMMKDDKKMDDSMIKKDEAMESSDSMMKKDESAMMQKAGAYTTYSSEALATAQKGKTVLFFHASWCPTCRAADADITKNLSGIPSGVTILRADYDKEVALKQKYGVTSQHTFVEVDSTGKMIQKWSGGNFAGIVAKI
jgi:thiol-disulfide isomerase/thioredoxin